MPSRDTSFLPRSVGRATVVDTSANDREVPCFCLEDFCGRSTYVSVESPRRGPELEGGLTDVEGCFFFLRCFSPLVVCMSSSSDRICACSRDPSRCLLGLSGSIGWPSRICEGGLRRETVKLDSMAGLWLKMDVSLFNVRGLLGCCVRAAAVACCVLTAS